MAFRADGSGWRQVPVQVDERARVDLAKPLGEAPVGHTFLTYTDPGTLVGGDPDTTLDGDDEVALMSADAGARSTAGAAPAGVVAGSGVELRVSSTLDARPEAYVYLFRSAGGLDPSGGRRYVDYRFRLLSGPYPSTYRIDQGPNPEDSAVTTAFYARHFADRWIEDGLRITAGGASGVDLLDRHKFLFAPGDCGRSEDTFSAGAGAFVVNRSGPVRAIRSYMGANSGRYTQRQHVFYERREDITTFLRVHGIGGGIDFLDLTPAAAGMRHRSAAHPAGSTVDGVPDVVTSGPVGWESVDGAQGGLSIVHTLRTDVSPYETSSYYQDDSTPPETQCTGDGAAWGASGVRLPRLTPNTDPTIGPANVVELGRHHVYEAPGRADGPRRRAQVVAPLQVAAAPWRPGP